MTVLRMLVPVLLGLALWQAVILVWDVPPFILPGPVRVAGTLWDARTLMEDRPVVLLDEPFSALDVATGARMQDLAAGALRGRTVLHVTHDPAEAARLGCRILILSQGGLHEVAAPAGPPPRSPDGNEVLAATGRLTRLLLGGA